MSGDVFTILGGKGGVGKTTTVVNVGIALQESGLSTVLVDADLGMSNLGELLGVDTRAPFHEVLAGNAELSAAITQGPADVSVIAGRGGLEAFAEADPSNIQPVLRTLAESYEVVLVDTGAGLSHEQLIPAGAADSVVLVTTADDVALVDTRKVAALAERVNGSVLGAVITRVEGDVEVSAIADELNRDVLAVVPDVDTTPADDPIVIDEPDSYAAQAYRRLGTKLANFVPRAPESTRP